MIFIGTAILLKYDIIAEQIRLLRAFQGPGLRRWGESFVSIFFYQIHPFITAAALYSIYAAVRKKDLKYLIILWLPLLAFAFQIKRIRYIIPVLPMLALMASYGLQKIKDSSSRKLIVSCVIVSSLVVVLGAYRPFLQTIAAVNVKNAGAFIDTVEAHTAEVFTLTDKGEIVNPAVLVPLLDLYTSKPVLYDYRPDNFPPKQEISVSRYRFSWEYKNPRYYSGEPAGNEKKALVIISRHTDDPLPPDIQRKAEQYRRSKLFNVHDGVYYYKIAIRVFW